MKYNNQTLNQKCVILFNDKAGLFKQTPGLSYLKKFLADMEFEADILQTKSPEHLMLLVKRLIKGKIKTIAIAGGDGTVSKAVQELAYSGSALGIIPLGTHNNFATALRIPQEWPSALHILKEGKAQTVSLGRVNNTYFTEAAGVGLFADALAIYGAGTNKNFFRGLYALVRMLFSFRSHRITVVVDGKTISKRAVMCMAANTYRFAAGLPIAPDAKLSDKYLDVVIIGDVTIKEMWHYYQAVRAQLHVTLPKVTCLKAKKITIRSATRLNVHCDDRIIGTTPAKITVEPAALHVMVGKI